jgi:hypothetical protein
MFLLKCLSDSTNEFDTILLVTCNLSHFSYFFKDTKINSLLEELIGIFCFFHKMPGNTIEKSCTVTLYSSCAILRTLNQQNQIPDLLVRDYAFL